MGHQLKDRQPHSQNKHLLGYFFLYGLTEEAISNGAVLEASKATLPVRYSVLKDNIFKTNNREGLENLTHAMCYLSGCGTSAVTDTLPIHYLGLLCKRMHCYVEPWYYPKNKEVKLEVMKQRTVQPHDRVKETMYYV